MDELMTTRLLKLLYSCVHVTISFLLNFTETFTKNGNIEDNLLLITGPFFSAKLLGRHEMNFSDFVFI